MKRNFTLHFAAILMAFNCCFSSLKVQAQLPEIKCITGLSASLNSFQLPQIQLFASDFVLSASPSNAQIAVRRAGTGSGFPVNPDGNPQVVLSFACPDLGTQPVELWIRDLQGNTAFCQTTIDITDPMGACQSNDSRLCVVATTENNWGIEGVQIENDIVVGGIPAPINVKTNADGYVCVENYFPAGTYVCITPTLEDDPLNGVDVLDLSLITKHYFGLEPLNTPYKLIAADANKSGTVTTFDIVELRKLILHHYESLPNNTSWRFINVAQVFSNPQNPFAEILEENNCLTITDSAVASMKFIGIKTGDVNLSAKASSKYPTVPPSDSLAGSVEERGPETAIYYFDAADRTVSEGEIFTLKINGNPDLTAWQFSLNADFLEVLDIIPGNFQNMIDFGVFTQPSGNGAYITSLAFQPVTDFSIQFKAQKSGKISDWLYFSNVLTPSLGYTDNLQVGIELRFSESSNTSFTLGAGNVLHQNSPNPWQHTTVMPFELQAASDVTIRITNAAGKVVATQSGWYPAGYHTVKIDQSQVKAKGVYFYQIETAGGVLTRKMVKE